MQLNMFLVILVIDLQTEFLQYAKCEHSTNKQIKTLKSIKLPACQACKLVIQSFYTELQPKLSQMSNAELGNVSSGDNIIGEIFKNICREERAKDQCRSLSEKCKEDLIKWWIKDQFDVPDLLQYLCIDKLHYCCPNGHYGPDCNPCPGYPDRVCNYNGKCKGNGTRKGSGQCACDIGYTGKLCDECAPSYYVSYKDDNKMLCVRCHSACESDCSGAGAKGCYECRGGWRMEKYKGCIDINECFNKRSPCKRNEFCVNNEGSYSCLACDAACDTCTGDGPDMCENCAPGFFLQDNICVNERKYVSYSDITRYLTYVGLCFATYIIFQNSPWAASIIGLCVAIYVTVSEYMLGTLTLTNFLSFSKTIEGLENIWKSDL